MRKEGSTAEERAGGGSSGRREGGDWDRIPLRVRWAEVDLVGVVYFANFFNYFELGQIEFLRNRGLSWEMLHKERNLFFPRVEARCTYRAPARYDEWLWVETRLERIGRKSITLRSRVLRQADEELLADGTITFVPVTPDWRSIEVPDDIAAALSGPASPIDK